MNKTYVWMTVHLASVQCAVDVHYCYDGLNSLSTPAMLVPHVMHIMVASYLVDDHRSSTDMI